MDVIELLKTDHQKVNDLFNQIDMTGGRQDGNLIQLIRHELSVHAELEENIFYPACERYGELKDIIQHSYREHKEVKTLLNRISMGGDPDLVRQLRDNVMHHVREEEGQLFPLVQKIMPRHELEQISRDIQHAKHQAGVQQQQRQGAGRMDY